MFRYSDFTLCSRPSTLPARPACRWPRHRRDRRRAGFGPRVLPDGSVFFNAYGCAFYRLSDIGSDNPRLDTVMTLDTPAAVEARAARAGRAAFPSCSGTTGSCQPASCMPSSCSTSPIPRRRARFVVSPTPATFNPHWLARDPQSNRLVLGAELGGEEGFFLLRFDAARGVLSFDDALHGDGQQGYLSLKNQPWAHGASGAAWAHAALFLPQ